MNKKDADGFKNLQKQVSTGWLSASELICKLRAICEFGEV